VGRRFAQHRVSLNPKAKWHDGHPVRSNDVRFTVVSAKDSSLGSPAKPVITNIDSVSAPDSLTAVYWFHARSPQQFYDAVYQLSIMPEHIWKGIPPASWRASDAAKNPVGSGQYRFVRWIPRAAFELVADTANYRGAPKLSRLIWTIAPDFQTAVTRVLAGEADFIEQLRPENMAEVAKHPELRTKQNHALQYSFTQFNLRDPANYTRPHPIFGNRELRRALTMATDRVSLVRSVFGTLAVPALGPTVRSYQTTDPNLTQIPFDLSRARQMLDSLGWRVMGSDGMRARNGRPLEFTLSVPSSSKLRVQMAVVIQEQLRQVGVKVDVEQLDFPVLMEKERKRTFDAAIGTLEYAAEPRRCLGSWGIGGSRATSGNNYGSYENPVFDAYVDSGLSAVDPASRKALFTKAYETIIQDAPAIWLAEPIQTVAYHSRIQLAAMRPDAWWIHIPEWWIPADKRIPRDNTPPSATPPAQPAGPKTP